MQGKNAVVFDLEIKKVPGQDCSWRDYDIMGISVGVLYDYLTNETKVYMDDNLQELTDRIYTADLVTGFNIDGFDIPLLAANTETPDHKPKTWDILYWSRRSTGWTGKGRFPKGMKLDDHLEAMFGADKMKIGHGAQAPVWWKEGKLGRLISYCIDDVAKERMLFEHIMKEGWTETFENGKNEVDRSLAFKMLEIQ